VMAGRIATPLARAARAALWCFERPYVLVMRVRNRLYEQGVMRARMLDRPVISVGNITTGGTGKSPVVAWLARQLHARGHKPAILLRGYRQANGESDEAAEYQHKLGPLAIPIRANRDRVASAQELIRTDPSVDLFILDDGMQHRRVVRQCEIVLVDATDPFGHDHVLPRGLLREPLDGLSRADVVLLTRVDRATPAMIGQITQEVTRHTPAPILKCRHVLRGLVDQAGKGQSLRGVRYFAFAGLGNPQPFFAQLLSMGGDCVGTRTFADHVRFASAREFADRVVKPAVEAGATAIVTTRKNAAVLPADSFALPVWVAELEVEFECDDGDRLLAVVTKKLGRAGNASRPRSI